MMNPYYAYLELDFYLPRWKNNKLCLIDSVTTNVMLKEKIFLDTLEKNKNNTTITRNNSRIVGFNPVIIILHSDNKFFYWRSVFVFRSNSTLMDICHSGYYITTARECVWYTSYVTTTLFVSKELNFSHVTLNIWILIRSMKYNLIIKLITHIRTKRLNEFIKDNQHIRTKG